MKNKYFILILLFVLPFFVTIFERSIRYSFLTIFQDNISVFVYGLSSIGLIIFSLFSKTDYGWDFNYKNRKNITSLLMILIACSFLLFFILQTKGLYNQKWNLGWIMWLLLVFREEIVLRGIIQTEASKLLVGRWLGLSKPIWFTSAIFALWHLVNLGTFTVQVVLIQIITVFLIAGPLYGWLKEKTNNVIITYLWHISADLFFFALYTLVFGKLLFPVWS